MSFDNLGETSSSQPPKLSLKTRLITKGIATIVMAGVLGYDRPIDDNDRLSLNERTVLLAFKQVPQSDLLSKIDSIDGEKCIPVEVTKDPLGYYCETIHGKFYYISGSNIYPILTWFNGRIALKIPFSK